MKYVITEQQNIVRHVLRRTEEDFDLIWDIIDEGVDMNLCHMDNFDEYFKWVCESSAMTYLFNYFDDKNQEGYVEMEKYMINFIEENFTTRIKEFWDDNKEDC